MGVGLVRLDRKFGADWGLVAFDDYTKDTLIRECEFPCGLVVVVSGSIVGGWGRTVGIIQWALEAFVVATSAAGE